MPHRWLQIRGDPAVRQFLFAQQRQDSAFDERIDQVHDIVRRLLVQKGVFHVKVHYASCQLTCWFHDDPYHYRVYLRDEVLAPAFLGSLPDISYEGRQPSVPCEALGPVLAEFRRLRLADEQIYLRSASVNRINGMIGMTFSCDGTHYLECDQFLQQLDVFGKEVQPCVESDQLTTG